MTNIILRKKRAISKNLYCSKLQGIFTPECLKTAVFGTPKSFAFPANGKSNIAASSEALNPFSMNKKGIIFDITELLWDFALVTAILICLAAVIFSYLNETFNTDEAEISLLHAKLINTPDCLAISNQNNIHTNQGVIDITKFEKENLKLCKIAEGTAIKLTLETINEKQLKTISIGPERMINLIRVCDSTVRNFKCFKKTSFISYTDTNNPSSKSIKPAILTMEVIKNA